MPKEHSSLRERRKSVVQEVLGMNIAGSSSELYNNFGYPTLPMYFERDTKPVGPLYLVSTSVE